MDDIYKELETTEGEGQIYRIAKSRNKVTNDFTQIIQLKDGHRVVTWEQAKIKDR